MTAQPTRRTLAKASAWAVPAIVTSVAAPAYAASPGPEFQANGYVSYNRNWYFSDYDYSRRLKLYSATMTGFSPANGYLIRNTTSSTTVSDASLTFWLASSALRFTTGTQFHNRCWSTLARDTRQASKSYRPSDSRFTFTYYAYTSTLNCSVQAQQGTTKLPTFAFESTSKVDTEGATPLGDFSYTDPTNYFFVESRVLVNGNPMIQQVGPVPVRLQ